MNAVAWLLFRFVSPASAVTFAVFVICPLASAPMVKTSEAVASSLSPSVIAGKLIVEPFELAATPFIVPLTNDKPAGMSSVKTIPVAVLGPAFDTVNA